MSFFETVYTKTSTFLRDLFLYAGSGALFLAIACTGIVASSGYDLDGWIQRFFEAGSQPGILIAVLLVIASYVAGHFLYSGSFLFFPILDAVWRRLPRQRRWRSLSLKRQMLRRIREGLDFESQDKEILERGPLHLFFEMSVFRAAPELHEKFVERYNLLMHMRRSVSSCFFYLALLFASIATMVQWTGRTMGVATICLLLALVFYRQQKITTGEFLDRVFTAYLLSARRPHSE